MFLAHLNKILPIGLQASRAEADNCDCFRIYSITRLPLTHISPELRDEISRMAMEHFDYPPHFSNNGKTIWF